MKNNSEYIVELEIRNGQARIAFHIECYNRYLFVVVEEENLDIAVKIMNEQYEKWVRNKLKDTRHMCCEEFILGELRKEGMIRCFSYWKNKTTKIYRGIKRWGQDRP